MLRDGGEQRDRGGSALEGDRGDLPQEQSFLPLGHRADAGQGGRSRLGSGGGFRRGFRQQRVCIGS